MDEMTLQEASEELNISAEKVIQLIAAHEIEGRQQDQEWFVTRESVISYKARRLVQENVRYSIDDSDR